MSLPLSPAEYEQLCTLLDKLYLASLPPTGARVAKVTVPLNGSTTVSIMKPSATYDNIRAVEAVLMTSYSVAQLNEHFKRETTGAPKGTKYAFTAVDTNGIHSMVISTNPSTALNAAMVKEPLCKLSFASFTWVRIWSYPEQSMQDSDLRFAVAKYLLEAGHGISDYGLSGDRLKALMKSYPSQVFNVLRPMKVPSFLPNQRIY